MRSPFTAKSRFVDWTCLSGADVNSRAKAVKICERCSAKGRCVVPTRGVEEDCRAREYLSFNVRRLRNEAELTQEQLSGRAGIDRSYLARLEAQSINISVNVLFALAKALEADPRDFLTPPHEVHHDD